MAMGGQPNGLPLVECRQVGRFAETQAKSRVKGRAA